jgi:hypothetical protein
MEDYLYEQPIIKSVEEGGIVSPASIDVVP